MTTESTEYEIFREKVRLVMAAQGVTQTELATRTGINLPDINRMLNQKQEPRISTMGKIAQAIDIPLYLLLDPKFEPAAAKASA